VFTDAIRKLFPISIPPIYQLRDIYDASGILSAHVETATLPVRLKCREPLYGLCHQLNVYGNTPFADLSGCFPASSADALDTRAHGFTTNQPTTFEGRRGAWFYQRHVTRGWTELDRRQLDNLSADTAPSLHASIEYPLPSSFPTFFRAQGLTAELHHTPRGLSTRPRAVPMVTTLSSGCTLPRLFAQYADFVGQCVRRRIDWAAVGCVDQDDARQLRDDLWTIRDNFGEMPELAPDGDDGGLGEDEEV